MAMSTDQFRPLLLVELPDGSRARLMRDDSTVKKVVMGHPANGNEVTYNQVDGGWVTAHPVMTISEARSCGATPLVEEPSIPGATTSARSRFLVNQAARVVGALLERPRLLGAVLRLLGVPCEGFQGVCHQSATVITNSQTCYDPSERKDARPGDLGRNRDYFFCPQCSEAYTEMMDDQWADYYSGRL